MKTTAMIGQIDPDRLYAGVAVARLLNVSTTTVWRWRRAGYLRARRLTPKSAPRYLGADLLALRDGGGVERPSSLRSTVDNLAMVRSQISIEDRDGWFQVRSGGAAIPQAFKSRQEAMKAIDDLMRDGGGG